MMVQSRPQTKERHDISIDWGRMAKPQKDAYDSVVTLEFAVQQGYVRQDFPGSPTFLDGAVSIHHGAALLDLDYVPASPNHPNISRACELLRLWPEVFTQCQQLIESVGIFTDPGSPDDLIVGSTCGNGGGFGKIVTTIGNHAGFAEALVHEMAHHKLRALGVEFESATRIITNSSAQKYKSPIRYDCLRPMTAVLHAQYSYTYISALDIEIIKAGQEPERDQYIAQQSLAINLPKLEFGYKVLQENVEVDAAGADFLAGLFTWLDSIFIEGYKIVDQFKIPRRVFVHPLDHQRKLSHSTLGTIGSEKIVPHKGYTVQTYQSQEGILLSIPEKETFFSLNETSEEIWNLCDSQHTLREIIETISQKYGCSENPRLVNEILSDVQGVILQLQDFDLLKLEVLEQDEIN